MASDLLSTIGGQIDARLKELRPLLAEYERLLSAADALVGGGGPVKVAAPRAPAAPRATGMRRATRGSAAGTIKRAAGSAAFKPSRSGAEVAKPVRVQRGAARDSIRAAGSAAPKPSKPGAEVAKPVRAQRGAARESILAALDHGSHTVGELGVVTAMSASNINGNLRRLASDGAVVKTEREGKTAYALASTG